MSGGLKGWGPLGPPPTRESFLPRVRPPAGSGPGQMPPHLPFDTTPPGSPWGSTFDDATAHYERMEALREKRQEAMQNLMAYGQEDLGPSAPSMQQFGPVSKSQFNLIDMVPEESIYDRQEKRKRKFFTEGLV